MPVLDPATGRVRLAIEELGALEREIREKPSDKSTRPVSLTAADLADPKKATARLVGPLARASYTLVLELAFAGPFLIYRFAGDEAGLVAARPISPTEVELEPMDPVVLPWMVAQLIRLSPRPACVLSEPAMVSVTALEDAERAGQGILGGGRQRLEADGIAESTARNIMELLVERQATWRAGSVWYRGMERVQAQTSTYVDAGGAGVVRLAPDGDYVRLSPSTAAEAWQDLLGTMPGMGVPSSDDGGVPSQRPDSPRQPTPSTSSGPAA